MIKKITAIIFILFCFAFLVYPGEDETYLNDGIAKAESGDWAGALADFNQAIALNPRYEQAYYERGLADDKLGNPKDAIIDYDMAIVLNPNDANAYNNRGLARYGLGDYGGAIVDYSKAISLDPNHASSYNNRGNAKYKLGDKTGAIEDYTRAIALNPECAQAYYNRGVIEDKYGDHFSALADETRASRIKSGIANGSNASGTQPTPQPVTQKAAIADFQKMNNDIKTFQDALTGCWDSTRVGTQFCYNQDGTCSVRGAKTNATWKIISVNTLSKSFILATISGKSRSYSYVKFVADYGEMVIYASKNDMQVGGNGLVFHKE